MKCLLLGAGYATRLYPLTLHQPKPLLPVGGIPILERLCDQVGRIREVDRIELVSNRRYFPAYEAWLAEYRRRRPRALPLRLHDDGSGSPEDRLGAIGDILFVLDRAALDDDLLVLAGDNLFQFALEDFVAAARGRQAAVCVKDLGSRERASLYGVVQIDPAGRVVDFEEKPPSPKGSLIALGVYLFSRSSLPLFRQYLAEGNKKDAPGFFLQWLCRRADVLGHRIEGEWFDIGDLDSYNRADALMTRGSGA
jgi:glucose-1-phosphate thymidylyltransferase